MNGDSGAATLPIYHAKADGELEIPGQPEVPEDRKSERRLAEREELPAQKHGDPAGCQYDHNTDDEGKAVLLGFKLVGLFVPSANGELELGCCIGGRIDFPDLGKRTCSKTHNDYFPSTN